MGFAAVEFVETSGFTRLVQWYALEDGLAALEQTLRENPTSGALDAGTNGLRKVRLADPGTGRGKRSGFRVHYLWIPRLRRIYLVHLFAKNDRDSLSPAVKERLRRTVMQIRAELE